MQGKTLAVLTAITLFAFVLTYNFERAFSQLFRDLSAIYAIWLIIGIPTFEEAIKIKVFRRYPKFLSGMYVVFLLTFLEALVNSIDPFTGNVVHFLFFPAFFKAGLFLPFIAAYYFKFNWEGYVFAVLTHLTWNFGGMFALTGVIAGDTYTWLTYGVQSLAVLGLFIWLLYDESFEWN